MVLRDKHRDFLVLSEFCNDVAKGVMLAAVIGQGVLPSMLGFTRALMSLFWILVSLFLLYLAVLFKREVNL